MSVLLPCVDFFKSGIGKVILPMVFIFSFASCERKINGSTKLQIQLPHTAAHQLSSTSNKVSGLSATPWGVSDPTTFNDISCFAIAIEAADLNQYTCVRSDDTVIMRPGVLVGSFPAGSKIEVEVPAGPKRKIVAIGFAATSLTACENFDTSGGPNYSQLSAPHIIGQKLVDLIPGDNTVQISATLSAAGKFDHCDKSSFDHNIVIPGLSVSDISITEGSSSTFAVTLDSVATSDISFLISLSSGTALYGTDFNTSFGNVAMVTIPTGSSAYFFDVNTIDDAIVESNESFTISVSSVVGANMIDPIGLGTIIDNDGSTSNLYIYNASAVEGQTLQFLVSLSATSASPVYFDWYTSDSTAIAGADYGGV